MAVWLFPIIRQRKTKYWFFFLVLGINDIWIGIIRSAVDIRASLLHVFSFALIFLYYSKVRSKRRSFLFVLCSSAILFALVFYFNIKEIDGTVLLLFLIGLFYFFAEDFALHALVHYRLNISLLILVFYQLLNVLKVLNLLLYNSGSDFYFYITSALQIIIGFFFAIFKIGDERFSIRVFKEL